MRGWLRPNRWYLLVLVALIPGAVVVSLVPRGIPYHEAQPQPEAVAVGETVRYSGADIRLTELELLDGAEIGASAGADVVVATFAIDVVDPPEVALCEVRIVSDESGFERFWDSELFPDGDYTVPDRFEQNCSLSDAGSYDLQMTFLVPRGEVQNPVVELSSSAALPRVLRLS